MKKICTSLLLAAPFIAGQVFAEPIYIDVSAATTQAPGNAGSGPDGDTFTSVFTDLQLAADTTTVFYDTNTGGAAGLNMGDRFLNSGTATVTDLLPTGGDDEGISFFSEITLAWAGLSGFATSDLVPSGPFGETVQTIAYEPNNTTISFYFQGDGSAPNADFGFNVGDADNTGFTDGEKVLDVKITGGTGSNTFDSFGNFVSGSSILNGEITYALNNFWFFDDGDTLPGSPTDVSFDSLVGSMLPIKIVSNMDFNSTDTVTDFSGAGTPGPQGFGNEILSFSSTHDGSANFQRVAVAVSVPPTWILMIFGLILLPFYRRKI